MPTAPAAWTHTRRGQQMHTPAPAQGLCLPQLAQEAVHDALASPCAPVAAPSRRHGRLGKLRQHGRLGNLGDTRMGGFLWGRHLRGRLARQYSTATRLLRTLMRHLFLPLPLAIPRLASCVRRSARLAALIARSAVALRRPAYLRAARPSAVALAPVALPAYHHFGLASPTREHPAIHRLRRHRRPCPEAPRARTCGLVLLACSRATSEPASAILIPHSWLARWADTVGRGGRNAGQVIAAAAPVLATAQFYRFFTLARDRSAPPAAPLHSGGWGGPPVLAVVLHDSQRQRSVHRWMMLAGLDPTHITCGGCAPSMPSALPRPLASTLLLTFNCLAFAGSVLMSRGGSIHVSAKGFKDLTTQWVDLGIEHSRLKLRLARESS